MVGVLCLEFGGGGDGFPAPESLQGQQRLVLPPLEQVEPAIRMV